MVVATVANSGVSYRRMFPPRAFSDPVHPHNSLQETARYLKSCVISQTAVLQQFQADSPE